MQGGNNKRGVRSAVRQTAQAVQMQMADADGRCRWQMQMRSTAVHSTAEQRQQPHALGTGKSMSCGQGACSSCASSLRTPVVKGEELMQGGRAKAGTAVQFSSGKYGSYA